MPREPHTKESPPSPETRRRSPGDRFHRVSGGGIGKPGSRDLDTPKDRSRK